MRTRSVLLLYSKRVELVFFWGGGGDTDRQGRGLTKHLTQTGRPWSRPRVSLSIYLSIYLHLGRCGWHRDLEVLENGIDLGVEVLHPRTQRLLCLDLGNIAAPFL